MDKLIIDDAVFLTYVGTQPEEVTSKQEIKVYIEIEFDIRKSAQTDDILDTIDYRDINHRLKLIFEKQHNLIETIAEEIAQDLLVNFDINSVLTRVNKAGSLPNAKQCAVEIIRQKGLVKKA